MSKRLPPMSKPAAAMPMMALRDVVVLPNNRVKLFVGRQLSLNALNDATGNDDRIVFVTQREEGKDIPHTEDLYQVGCLAKVIKVLESENSSKQVLVSGQERVLIDEIETTEKLQRCQFSVLAENDWPAELGSLFDQLRQLYRVEDNEIITAALRSALVSNNDFAAALDRIAGALKLPVQLQQDVLEELSVTRRAQLLLDYQSRERDIIRLESEFNEAARSFNRGHRRNYLKERAADIQSALGDSGMEDVEELRRKVTEAGMNEDARSKCNAEINRLMTMTPMSPEASVIRSYLDVLLALPWSMRTELNYDLAHARMVLDADHKGLEKVKDRIIEYLAVQQQVGHNRGSVMCFLGPPGVGKTSLGMSIAKATGRHFVRLALGGVHDEATIRGHRRTYVASMPGRILRAMQEAKVVNPVFMLDEIDKLTASFNGDPMAALLEVIDPEQNSQFVDQYAEVEFDLSEVMFIATANSADTMYAALHDRLETIELPGYTDREKLAIARQHLVPKLMTNNGLAASELSFSASVLQTIIRDYTKEAGVRSLERNIAKVCRKVVLERDIVTNKKTKKTSPKIISKAKVRSMLGAPMTFRALKRRDSVGIVNGLAVVKDWEGIVHQIDAIRLPGEDGLVKTGNLMPHIEHSIDTACAVLRANPGKYGLDPSFLDRHQVHIHYPNIDIAHDGNSNGLALFALLVSVLNDIPVRVDTAITGAINLRGDACAVGGLREKLVGAWRERIHRVIVPQVQIREVADVPRDIADELEVIPVKDVNEVLRHLLVRQPKPVKSKPQRVLVVKPKTTSARSTSANH